ncbi:unnamed protein product, partial [Polarella glacialis]
MYFKHYFFTGNRLRGKVVPSKVGSQGESIGKRSCCRLEGEQHRLPTMRYRSGTFTADSQRSNADLPAGLDQACSVIDLDLSFNPVDDEGAEALASAAIASTKEKHILQFKAPWGVERLHLGDTCISSRGCMALCMAVASRAALADAAAKELGSSCDDSFFKSLSVRRVRRPAGLQVVGLKLDDAPAARMRTEAETRLKELWPEPAVAADEAAGASLLPRREATVKSLDDLSYSGSEGGNRPPARSPSPPIDGTPAADDTDANSCGKEQVSDSTERYKVFADPSPHRGGDRSDSGCKTVHMRFTDCPETKVEEVPNITTEDGRSSWFGNGLRLLHGSVQGLLGGSQDPKDDDGEIEGTGGDGPDGMDLWYADEEMFNQPHTVGGRSMLGAKDEDRAPRRRMTPAPASLPAELARAASAPSDAGANNVVMGEARCPCGGTLPAGAVFCPRCGARCTEAGRRAASEMWSPNT